MNAPYEMAKLLKERNNIGEYTPISGIVERLPDLKIRISPKAVLDTDDIASIIDVKVQDSKGNFIYMNKRVYLLPLSGSGKKFLLIGAEISL